jgi:hypothetical protein
MNIPTQRTAPVKPQSGVVANDRKVDLRGLGGKVYSTGLEDIWVRLIPQDPTKEKAYLSQIHIISPGKKRHLGSNYESKFLNLGKIPAGEIQIEPWNTVERAALQTGPASRNEDGLPHATVRQLPTGVVDVRFENSPGLPEGKRINKSPFDPQWVHDHYFQDAILEFSGGVTADPMVMALLTMLKDPDPEKRKTATTALRQVYPKIARAAGVH